MRDLDNSQLRFNSGFHDGQSDAEANRPDRRNWEGNPFVPGEEWRPYRDGYFAGRGQYEREGVRCESSLAAWEAYSA